MASKDDVRKLVEKDLWAFACLMHPNYIYGDIHKECFRWLSKSGVDQLLLLPRGHLKSQMIATWCVWHITNHPDATILYVSATDDLAILQLGAIKAMLESDTYRKYWPDMIHPEDAKREEWNVKNVKVDHPLRKQMGVRDRTVAARSVGSNTTGLHCSVLVFDDLVVPGNAYTEEGRARVAASYSQFSSIANTGCITKAVGTRYHGKDIYGSTMLVEVEELYDDSGNIVGERPMYQVKESPVEDGGVFLWPRTKHVSNNKWEGFDNKELAKKRAKYFAAGERSQFYAQYYNNPNDGGEDSLSSDKFIYYDRKYLATKDGVWYFKDKPLAVFAAVDLAYTTGERSDYTAIATIGIDPDGFVYILELDQFRTNKYEKTYQEIERLHRKWMFKKIRLETNAGANLVCEYVKDEARRNGLSLAVEGKPAKGEKLERAQMILLPRYENQSVLHYQGGLITTYEEQLLLPRPAHDDLRDAVSMAVEISKPASKRRHSETSRGNVIQFDARFGGRLR